MELYSTLSALNRSLINVAKATNKLNPVVIEEPVTYSRLKESTFVISEDMKRFSACVTAHDLREYRNVLHTINLEENEITWLDRLLLLDKGEGINEI